MQPSRRDNEIEIEYSSAMKEYTARREIYYTNILHRNKKYTTESNEYIDLMQSNRRLQTAVRKMVLNMQRNIQKGSIVNRKSAEVHASLVNTNLLLGEEREINDEIIQKYGTISSNVVVAKQYARAEGMKQSIWGMVCILVLILFSKSVIAPSSSTDIFSTFIFSIIIFLVVSVTRNLGTSNMFSIWLLLLGMILAYMLKYKFSSS